MEIPDDLRSVFSAEVTEQHDSFVIEVPEREVEIGDVQDGEVYRVALLATETTASADTEQRQTKERQTQQREQTQKRETQERGFSGPPVGEGDTRTVDIESIGEQGDGIARVERGYVVIVPETEKGERVTIEITDVKENVAFGEVVEREEYYE